MLLEKLLRFVLISLQKAHQQFLNDIDKKYFSWISKTKFWTNQDAYKNSPNLRLSSASLSKFKLLPLKQYFVL